MVALSCDKVVVISPSYELILQENLTPFYNGNTVAAAPNVVSCSADTVVASDHQQTAVGSSAVR